MRPPKDNEESPTAIERKFGRAIASAGWTAVPSILLERQDALGLDATDLAILAHLFKHWWTKDSLPCPSKGTIAKRLGITSRTVQKRIARMEDEGLVARRQRPRPGKRHASNEYELAGLMKKLEPMALEAVEQRKKQEAERQERLRRKRPHLHAVK